MTHTLSSEKNMPSIEQIRAARALLDWSQTDLADKAGLSQTGIARIENGTNKPNSSTLDKIKTAFDVSGIEFITGGVKRNVDQLITFEGEDCLRKLQDDVYHTVTKDSDDVRIMGVDEITPGEQDDFEYTKMHIKRLLKAGIQEKILVDETEDSFIAPREWYRIVPKEAFSPHTIMVYGSKIALCLRDPHYKVLVLDNPFFAQNMKSFFDFIWDKSKPA